MDDLIDEREELLGILVDATEEGRPATIPGAEWDALASTVITMTLRRLRGMSARQVAVLLDERAGAPS